MRACARARARGVSQNLYVSFPFLTAIPLCLPTIQYFREFIFTQNMEQWNTLVNRVMKLTIPRKPGVSSPAEPLN